MKWVIFYPLLVACFIMCFPVSLNDWISIVAFVTVPCLVCLDACACQVGSLIWVCPLSVWPLVESVYRDFVRTVYLGWKDCFYYGNSLLQAFLGVLCRILLADWSRLGTCRQQTGPAGPASPVREPVTGTGHKVRAAPSARLIQTRLKASLGSCAKSSAASGICGAINLTNGFKWLLWQGQAAWARTPADP